MWGKLPACRMRQAGSLPHKDWFTASEGSSDALPGRLPTIQMHPCVATAPLTGDELVNPARRIPTTLTELRQSGWKSRTVKQEIRDNFLRHAAVRRGALSRHRRLRQHRHPRDQPRPDRRARHALPRREGPGQEPADALARRASSTRRFPISTSPAVRSTRTPTAPSPRPANGCWPRLPEEQTSASPGGRESSATPNAWLRAPSSPT